MGATADNWACSSVKLGDEKKKGVERSWATEYDVEYSSARLKHGSWMDRDDPVYDVPKGPKDGTTYAASNQAVDLERLFGQKVKERGGHAVLALHRELLKVVDHDMDSVPLRVLEGLLFPWGLMLDDHDRAVMQHRYQARTGGECINLGQFLAVALPRDFGHLLQCEETPKLQARTDWVRWTSGLHRERPR